MHACLPACLPAYLPTYLPTCVRTFVRTHMHACIHTYVRTYVHATEDQEDQVTKQATPYRDLMWLADDGQAPVHLPHLTPKLASQITQIWSVHVDTFRTAQQVMRELPPSEEPDYYPPLHESPPKRAKRTQDRTRLHYGNAQDTDATLSPVEEAPPAQAGSPALAMTPSRAQDDSFKRVAPLYVSQDARTSEAPGQEPHLHRCQRDACKWPGREEGKFLTLRQRAPTSSMPLGALKPLQRPLAKMALEPRAEETSLGSNTYITRMHTYVHTYRQTDLRKYI